jgi:hypothetical protein
MPLLQLTLSITLSGVLTPVFNLNVQTFLLFRRFFAHFLLGANGVKMKIWQCFANLPQQTWTPIEIAGTSGTIKLTAANFCFDLTNGIKTNQNVMQIPRLDVT